MPRAELRALVFLAVVIVHGIVSLLVGFGCFFSVYYFGPDHSVTKVLTGIGYVLWYPYLALQSIGLSPGPVDSGNSVVLNSLLWTAIGYTLVFSSLKARGYLRRRRK